MDQGLLSEHEAANMNPTPAGYQPSEEERKALKLAKKLFEKAKRGRKKYDEHWLEYYHFFRGKQWKEQRPSYRHSEVINMVWQMIQSTVPILTDARQRFEFLPQEPMDMEFAKILDQVAESDWTANNWSYQLAETLYDGHILGTGIPEVGYDGEAKLGQGSATFYSKDPFYCFPDPKAKDVNVDSDFFIYAEPVEIEKLKREYPEKAPFLKPDLLDLTEESKMELDQVRYQSPTDKNVPMEGYSPEQAMGKDQCLKITIYLKDYDFIEEEQKSVDPETGIESVQYVQRLKYPNGRKICVASGVVLSDGPNPYEDGLFPFARYANYIDPRVFWGISEIESLKSPQMIFNKLLNFALDVLTLMGNPIWKVGTGSGVDPENLFNAPGMIIEADDINQVQREEGVSLQPYVLQLAEMMRVWFNDTAGSQDVTRGARPEGITAASAISSLQEAAQTRVRQKSRNLDALLQNAGQLYKNRVLQFYTAPRIIRSTGNENAQQFFKFHIETRDDGAGNTQKVGIVRQYNQDPTTGQYFEELEAKEYIIRGDFDVKVSTGSTLPFAKDNKFNQARMMYQDKALSRLDYIKASGIENPEGVYQRLLDEEAQVAQAQMAAQMGAGPSGMPPEGAPPAA